MAQKVVTAHKVKSWQETTSLGQIATVTAKPTISNRWVTWDPPPPWQGLFFTSISPEIWFVTFSKIWNLFACAVLVLLFFWLRKRCDLAQKMVWLVNKSHRANQIAWITSDFKVDVIKGKNQPHWLESKCAKKNAPLPEIKGDFDILL